MTKYMIELNFRQANAQADALDEQATQLRTLANSQLDGIMQQLRGSWTGDAANAYLDKCAQMRQQILTSVNQLTNNADALRKAARRLYNAEMTALRLANERAARL